MSVKTYKANQQLTPHFNSSEFMCKCGCKVIKVDDRLLTMLETLYDRCSAKSITVTSGYRCPSYDKKIGGFVGKHAQGLAADIKIKGQDGKWVSTKIISCIAQDEFASKGAGIANINKDYTAIHIDARLGSVYRGNELVSNSSVTKDFYAYYGISKQTIANLAKKSTQQPVILSTVSTVYQGVDYAPVFDFDYYYNKYPDLQKACGKDKQKLFNHFINSGMKEARQANAEFNVAYYKNRYVDLRKAYGIDLTRYYLHYIKYGIKEKRDAKTACSLQGAVTTLNGVDYSAVYDFNYYQSKYADIRKAFGDDDIKTLQHFVNYGMKEGRQAKANFNVYNYKNRYKDLQKAYGDDLPSYYRHYIKYGLKEKRNAK